MKIISYWWVLSVLDVNKILIFNQTQFKCAFDGFTSKNFLLRVTTKTILQKDFFYNHVQEYYMIRPAY